MAKKSDMDDFFDDPVRDQYEKSPMQPPRSTPNVPQDQPKAPKRSRTSTQTPPSTPSAPQAQSNAPSQPKTPKAKNPVVSPAANLTPGHTDVTGSTRGTPRSTDIEGPNVENRIDVIREFLGRKDLNRALSTGKGVRGDAKHALLNILSDDLGLSMDVDERRGQVARRRAELAQRRNQLQRAFLAKHDARGLADLIQMDESGDLVNRFENYADERDPDLATMERFYSVANMLDSPVELKDVSLSSFLKSREMYHKEAISIARRDPSLSAVYRAAVIGGNTSMIAEVLASAKGAEYAEQFRSNEMIVNQLEAAGLASEQAKDRTEVLAEEKQAITASLGPSLTGTPQLAMQTGEEIGRFKRHQGKLLANAIRSAAANNPELRAREEYYTNFATSDSVTVEQLEELRALGGPELRGRVDAYRAAVIAQQVQRQAIGEHEYQKSKVAEGIGQIRKGLGEQFGLFAGGTDKNLTDKINSELNKAKGRKHEKGLRAESTESEDELIRNLEIQLAAIEDLLSLVEPEKPTMARKEFGKKAKSIRRKAQDARKRQGSRNEITKDEAEQAKRIAEALDEVTAQAAAAGIGYSEDALTGQINRAQASVVSGNLSDVEKAERRSHIAELKKQRDLLEAGRIAAENPDDAQAGQRYRGLLWDYWQEKEAKEQAAQAVSAGGGSISYASNNKAWVDAFRQAREATKQYRAELEKLQAQRVTLQQRAQAGDAEELVVVDEKIKKIEEQIEKSEQLEDNLQSQLSLRQIISNKDRDLGEAAGNIPIIGRFFQQSFSAGIASALGGFILKQSLAIAREGLLGPMSISAGRAIDQDIFETQLRMGTSGPEDFSRQRRLRRVGAMMDLNSAESSAAISNYSAYTGRSEEGIRVGAYARRYGLDVGATSAEYGKAAAMANLDVSRPSGLKSVYENRLMERPKFDTDMGKDRALYYMMTGSGVMLTGAGISRIPHVATAVGGMITTGIGAGVAAYGGAKYLYHSGVEAARSIGEFITGPPEKKPDTSPQLYNYVSGAYKASRYSGLPEQDALRESFSKQSISLMEQLGGVSPFPNLDIQAQSLGLMNQYEKAFSGIASPEIVGGFAKRSMAALTSSQSDTESAIKYSALRSWYGSLSDEQKGKFLKESKGIFNTEVAPTSPTRAKAIIDEMSKFSPEFSNQIMETSNKAVMNTLSPEGLEMYMEQKTGSASDAIRQIAMGLPKFRAPEVAPEAGSMMGVPEAAGARKQVQLDDATLAFENAVGRVYDRMVTSLATATTEIKLAQEQFDAAFPEQ